MYAAVATALTGTLLVVCGASLRSVLLVVTRGFPMGVGLALSAHARLFQIHGAQAGEAYGYWSRLSEGLGESVAFALVYNVWDLISRESVHARTTIGDPPTYGDAGYRPLHSGNLVFLYSGLTYGFASGSYWSAQGAASPSSPTGL